MKRVTAIARKTLRMILEASRDMYPREFGAILRAEEGTITELILVPGTISGKRHAIFQLHTLPADFSVVGTVHSHPSGVYEPSDEDRALFNKFGGIHLIDRKSTRLNSSHDQISYAVFCLKKKNQHH